MEWPAARQVTLCEPTSVSDGLVASPSISQPISGESADCVATSPSPIVNCGSVPQSGVSTAGGEHDLVVVPRDTEHEGVATVAVVTSCTCALCIARMFDSASLEAKTGKQATTSDISIKS